MVNMLTLRGFLNTTTILRDGTYAAIFPIDLEDTRDSEYRGIHAEFARMYDAREADRIITKIRLRNLSAFELSAIRLQASMVTREMVEASRQEPEWSELLPGKVQ